METMWWLRRTHLDTITYTRGDDRCPTSSAATAGVVLSHRLWQSRFGSYPAIIGSTVSLNSHSVTFLGVMPRSFATRVDPMVALREE
jgi:hypothetical protein